MSIQDDEHHVREVQIYDKRKRARVCVFAVILIVSLSLLLLLLWPGFVESMPHEGSETTRPPHHEEEQEHDEPPTKYELSNAALVKQYAASSSSSTGKNKNQPSVDYSVERTASTDVWWEQDPPGLDYVPGKPRTSLWDYELSPAIWAKRPVSSQRNPQLVFIKLNKVGGTSISTALNTAAQQNKIALLPWSLGYEEKTLHENCLLCNKKRTYSMYFHHSFRRSCTSKCIPHARFVTVLRDPMAQTISWYCMALNQKYFEDYPKKKCPYANHYPLPSGLGRAAALELLEERASKCVDSAFRKNVTLDVMGTFLREESVPPPLVPTFGFLIGDEESDYSRFNNNAKSLIDFLTEKYFLVGVTERIDEFLVLLAVHMGWKLSDVYYVYCKPVNIHITEAEFAWYHPNEYARLKKELEPLRAVHAHFLAEFDKHTARLGPWFAELVQKFRAGMSVSTEANKKNKFMGKKYAFYKWRKFVYLDGVEEDC